jgi:hypothetical protein
MVVQVRGHGANGCGALGGNIRGSGGFPDTLRAEDGEEGEKPSPRQ